MAARGLPVTVTVTYSNEKHTIQVASHQEDSEPTLQDMALLIEQITGVPVPFQKLICKGKSLKEMEQPLSALGVKSGCKVMLIGKRNSPEEEVELKKLKDLEKSVEQIANKLEEVNKEFTGIQKGFLAKDLQAEALNHLDKRIKGTAEQFMKILEQIDAIRAARLHLCSLDRPANGKYSRQRCLVIWKPCLSTQSPTPKHPHSFFVNRFC
ncbi:BAG family molecular chaperone regulator 1 isoform X2 [Carettochelys insculpta]|uniref:BAG family molecular chaperone regulator 1 isoform X2 n=1 Tax=Carettochelys insculpta TaxID=44489 RepID=UPI003EB6E482